MLPALYSINFLTEKLSIKQMSPKGKRISPDVFDAEKIDPQWVHVWLKGRVNTMGSCY